MLIDLHVRVRGLKSGLGLGLGLLDKYIFCECDVIELRYLVFKLLGDCLGYCLILDSIKMLY